MLTVDFYSL